MIRLLLCTLWVLSIFNHGSCGSSGGTMHDNDSNRKRIIKTRKNSIIDLQDVNIFVLTDTHSWLNGHKHMDSHPTSDATIGNITSFVAAVKEIAKRDGKDVFFLDNGDNVDGTGLSNASPVDAQNLFPLLMKVPFDAMSLGNHELYFSSTIEMMVSSGYITSRNGSYLTSNVVFKANDGPLGSRYCILRGFNSGIRLLAFGFLYEMTDHSDIVRVEDVAEVVRSEWFVTAVAEEKYDAIVVLAHMDNADSLVETLLSGIRALVSPHMPVVFLTGHSHNRAYSEPDAFSTNLEAGNYANTLGFISFNLSSRAATSGVGKTDDSLCSNHIFFNTNVEELCAAVGMAEDDIITQEGLDLDKDVTAVRSEMGVLNYVGCSDAHYFVSQSIDKPYSLYGLYVHTVVPDVLFSPVSDEIQILVAGTGLLRYDLFAGEVIADDIWTLSPFEQPYVQLKDIPGEQLEEAIILLNSNKFSTHPPQNNDRVPISQSDRGFDSSSATVIGQSSLPNYVISSSIESGVMYNILATEWDGWAVANALDVVTDGQNVVEPQPYGPSSLNCTSVWFTWLKEFSNCPSKQ